MAKYKVEVAVTGTVTVEVEAENAQNAKDVALAAVDNFSFGKLSKINTQIGCVENDAHRDVTFERPSFGIYRHNKGHVPHYVNYGEEAF